jgi:hypothetical protein
MSENKKTHKAINKATEYPVIYSYIYERESQDIRRLAGNFKTTKRTTKKTANRSNSTRIITGFKIEGGKAIPIYSDKPAAVISDGGIKQKSKVVVAKGGVVKRKSQNTTRKTTTSRIRTKKDNPGEEK